MIKSYSFYSYKLNKDKYNIIKNYAIVINEYKNLLSKHTYKYYLLDIYYGLSRGQFMNKTKDLREKDEHNIKFLNSVAYQQLQRQVYTRYETRIKKSNILDYKIIRNTPLQIAIKYLVKAYKGDKNKIIDYLNKSKQEYHKDILHYINKFGDRLFKLAQLKQRNLLKQIKIIEFKSLTFASINVIGSKNNDIDMIEPSKNIKLTNAIINLNLPKISKLEIPTRYSKKYHGNLNDYEYGINKSNGQKSYSYTCQILDNNKIKIILTKDDGKIANKINNHNNVIGIDVNVKHNLFSLSDNQLIEYDQWIIDKYRRHSKYISRVQRNKEKQNKKNEGYGKKVTKRIQKMNRISKYYADYKANELITYCKNNGINHIVMENLNLQNNKTRAKKDDLNYNDIIKVLHLNDLKNVIKRIGNRENIMVSFVDPSYTSQTCPYCGHISRENRKMQETFSCIKCGHTNNADVNAAINIRNRYAIDELRDILMAYDNEKDMYIENKKRKKEEYIEIYKNLNKEV